MDPNRAREILRTLADGRDPATGATFPPDCPYQQADTVRALHVALDALSDQPRTRNQEPGTPTHQPPARWTPDEESRLRAAFAAQTPIPAIAAAHARTRGAITSRLVKLCLLAPPDHPAGRGHLPSAPEPAPQLPPRPPNPKPDNDLPF
jgi:hypothetical protein